MVDGHHGAGAKQAVPSCGARREISSSRIAGTVCGFRRMATRLAARRGIGTPDLVLETATLRSARDRDAYRLSAQRSRERGWGITEMGIAGRVGPQAAGAKPP